MPLTDIQTIRCCAKRVASRDKINREESPERVRVVNNECAEYIKMRYDTDINDHCVYDLTLNSDRYNRVQIYDLIPDATDKAGYKLPDETRQPLSNWLRQNISQLFIKCIYSFIPKTSRLFELVLPLLQQERAYAEHDNHVHPSPYNVHPSGENPAYCRNA